MNAALVKLEVCIAIMTGIIVEHVLHFHRSHQSAHYYFKVLCPVPLCVFVQEGKETTEEEDEVAVGMEKGFMDEFFEQVCSSLSVIPIHTLNRLIAG